MRYTHMNICLKKADPAKKEILFRLLQYSLFEESLHDQNTINEDALFDYPWFDLYFTEKDRGIAEFMILPSFRRNHIGRDAALQCFEMYPGNWEVSPSFGSRQAYLFWENVIGTFTDGNCRYEDGIFIFDSRISTQNRL